MLDRPSWIVGGSAFHIRPAARTIDVVFGDCQFARDGDNKRFGEPAMRRACV